MIGNIVGPFQGPWAYLSNFYERKFVHTVNPELEIEVPTSEHAYQFEKFERLEDTWPILDLKTPGQAKRYASKHKDKHKPGFHDTKIEIMERIIHEKFAQNYDLSEKLINTFPDVIMEYNKWHDNFWGICTCPQCINIEGQNNLGLILIRVREFRREEKMKRLGEALKLAIRVQGYMPEWRAAGMFKLEP